MHSHSLFIVSLSFTFLVFSFSLYASSLSVIIILYFPFFVWLTYYANKIYLTLSTMASNSLGNQSENWSFISFMEEELRDIQEHVELKIKQTDIKKDQDYIIHCEWRWQRQMGKNYGYVFSSVQFSHSVMSDSFWPHESQHARPPCPSPTPGDYSNSCPSSQWCHAAISSSVVPFSSYPLSLPASGSFPMSQLFAWRGQSTGVSASASVLPVNTQDWSPSGWTG